ncbi:MAG: DapH/DapD/GlmU-related protein [Halarchaeum sp.]
MSLGSLVDRAVDYYQENGPRRTVWVIIHYLIWRFRATVFRLRHARSLDAVGSALKIRGSDVYLRASHDATVTIGDAVELVGDFDRSTFFKVGGAFHVEDGVFINRGCEIYATDYVRLAENATIAPNVIIRDSDMHGVGDGEPKQAPVLVEANAWVGTESIVLKGVTIGEDAVVGAGSVVTDDVPPDTVVAGIPAGPIDGADD